MCPGKVVSTFLDELGDVEHPANEGKRTARPFVSPVGCEASRLN